MGKNNKKSVPEKELKKVEDLNNSKSGKKAYTRNMNFRTKWYDRDFRELEENNTLSEIAILYGAYLEYINTMNEKDFESYYESTKTKMKEIFINNTNRAIKNKLRENGICSSGRKMRRLYFTGRNKCVKSYSWIDSFFKCLLSQLIKNDALLSIVTKKFLVDCNLCVGEKDKYIYICCTTKLLGFQYYMLNKFATYPPESKKKTVARECLNSIVSSNEIKEIKNKCLAYKEEQNAIL